MKRVSNQVCRKGGYRTTRSKGNKTKDLNIIKRPKNHQGGTKMKDFEETEEDMADDLGDEDMDDDELDLD